MMTAQKFWDENLTATGHINALLKTGHAAGWAGYRWDELPADVRRSLTKRWAYKHDWASNRTTRNRISNNEVFGS